MSWLYKYKIATLVHKSLHLASKLNEFFIKRKTKYSLRGRNKLVIPQPRTEILRRSIAYRGAVNWNYLEESLQEKGYTVFKKLVKKHLDDVPMKPNLKPNDCDFIYS